MRELPPACQSPGPAHWTRPWPCRTIAVVIDGNRLSWRGNFPRCTAEVGCNDRRLERRRARARIRERPVCAGVVCRQDRSHAQERRRQAADLCAVAGRLLHVLDILRQRRPGRIDRLQLHSRLSRPDPALRCSAGAFCCASSALAKSHNITSVADFLAARYGKSQAVGAIVTVIAVAGTLPYIALQLKAVALSVTALLGARQLQLLHLPSIRHWSSRS